MHRQMKQAVLYCTDLCRPCHPSPATPPLTQADPIAKQKIHQTSSLCHSALRVCGGRRVHWFTISSANEFVDIPLGRPQIEEKQLGPGLVAKSTTTQRNFQRFNAQVRGHQPTTLAAGSALKTKTSSICPGRDGIICNQKLVSNLCQCTMNTDLRSNGHTPAPTLQPKICPGKTKPNREP